MSGSVGELIDSDPLDQQIDTLPSEVEPYWQDIPDSDTVLFPVPSGLLPNGDGGRDEGILGSREDRDLDISIRRFLYEQGFRGEISRKQIADIRPFFKAAKKAIFSSDVASLDEAFKKPTALKTRKRTKSEELNVDLEFVDLEQIRAARRLVTTYHRRRRAGTVKLKQKEIEKIKAAESLVNAYNRRKKASSHLTP